MNVPVKGTATPSRLDNFALDANTEFDLASGCTLLLGGSYLHGSAYCQDFPLPTSLAAVSTTPPSMFTEGSPSETSRSGLKWPGRGMSGPETFNPALPGFPASKVSGFDIGAKYRHDAQGTPVDFSAEFSRFTAGPAGAPWERQDQTVLGVAWFPRPNAKLFAEYIRVDGFAPLDFISGGNIEDEEGEPIPDATQSDRSARTDVLLAELNLAF